MPYQLRCACTSWPPEYAPEWRKLMSRGSLRSSNARYVVREEAWCNWRIGLLDSFVTQRTVRKSAGQMSRGLVRISGGWQERRRKNPLNCRARVWLVSTVVRFERSVIARRGGRRRAWVLELCLVVLSTSACIRSCRVWSQPRRGGSRRFII